MTYPLGLLDSELIIETFSEDKETAIRKFREFNETENSDKRMEDTYRMMLTDEEAKIEIEKIISIKESMGIKSLPKDQRNTLIRKIKEIKVVSQRQTARILGVAPNLIFQA